MDVVFGLLVLLIYAGIYVFLPDTRKKWSWLCLALWYSLKAVVNVLAGNYVDMAILLVWALLWFIFWDRERKSN